jgi:hypothetical protein
MNITVVGKGRKMEESRKTAARSQGDLRNKMAESLRPIVICKLKDLGLA